jgi:serine protease Do
MRFRLTLRPKLLIVLLTAALLLLGLAACSGSSGVPGPAGPPGPTGVGVTGASINGEGHLILTLSDGKTLDAGSPAGPTVTTTVTTTPAVITMGDLFALLRPVIVRVNVTGSGFIASGSGVIIRDNGYVVTNQHVIDSARTIAVTLSNDRQYPATVTASDANLDLAILQFTGIPADWPAAALGSSSDVIVGGIVIAAGFPLGINLPGPASFTQGIVSAIRNLDGQNYVQTDVAINPGSSGGALVNRTNGKIIGITSAAILPPGEPVSGIGLAIPIDVVQTYIQNNLPQ